jgi:hypothetical protein
MPPPVAPRDVHTWINEFLRQRPDIGLGSAIRDMMFEPRNPFDSTARRKPRTAFLLGTTLLAAFLGCFCYFNFAR